jgi:FkbM family methyltransferase
MRAARALKKIVASVICHPWVGSVIQRAFAFRIPYAGWRFRVPDDGDPSVAAYLLWGMYESAERRFVQRYIRRDLDVVELGSSIGVISCYIAGRLSPECQLICVEANPDLIPVLHENLRANHPGRHFEVVHAACGKHASGMDSIWLAVGESNLTSSITAKRPPSHAVRVSCITLGEIVTRFGILDFVLVADIEGAERISLRMRARSCVDAGN